MWGFHCAGCAEIPNITVSSRTESTVAVRLLPLVSLFLAVDPSEWSVSHTKVWFNVKMNLSKNKENSKLETPPGMHSAILQLLLANLGHKGT